MIPVLVLGESGSGKSTSLRNFEPDEISVFNVASKPLPFRKKLPVLNLNGKADPYGEIKRRLTAPNKKAYAIDDSQYLLAFEFFARAKERGYDKFTEIAVHFKDLVDSVLNGKPDDTIVYFLHHTEYTDGTGIKAKTIGKMLDEKLTVEGMFPIVLLCRAEKGKYTFITQSDGVSTAKSPMDMLPHEMDNDLKAVDTAIRSYWWPQEEQKEGPANAES